MASLLRTFAAPMVLLVAATLYGCGGSGGGSPGTMDGDMSSGDMSSGDMGTGDGDETEEPFIDERIADDNWRHAAASYARAAIGGQEPTLPSSGHEAKVREIIAGSNTIRMLHFWNPGNGVWEQLDPNCSGTTCDFNNPDGIPTTKDNFAWPWEATTILPIMRHRGAELHFASSTGADDLGPWAGNAFAAPLEHVAFGTSYIEWDSGEAASIRWVVGDATGANPAAGTATWSGAMVGAGSSDTASAWIQGDVSATVHFGSSPTVDVMFANVVSAEERESQVAAAIDPWMGIPLANGSFQSGTNFGDYGDRYLEGQFFGPDAGEVAGVFYDFLASDPGLYMEGAFGAVRDQP